MTVDPALGGGATSGSWVLVDHEREPGQEAQSSAAAKAPGASPAGGRHRHSSWPRAAQSILTDAWPDRACRRRGWLRQAQSCGQACCKGGGDGQRAARRVRQRTARAADRRPDPAAGEPDTVRRPAGQHALRPEAHVVSLCLVSLCGQRQSGAAACASACQHAGRSSQPGRLCSATANRCLRSPRVRRRSLHAWPC